VVGLCGKSCGQIRDGDVSDLFGWVGCFCSMMFNSVEHDQLYMNPKAIVFSTKEKDVLNQMRQ
jgi:hypothetical protein